MSRVIAVWCSLCLAASAQGQGFELDLSEEKPLPKTPAEFRPSIAILSVHANDGDAVSHGRASLIEAELIRQLAQEDLFDTVMEPAAVAERLGAQARDAKTCTDFACMEAIARTLKVSRLVRFTVAKQGVGSIVTLTGYDPGFNALLTQTYDSQERPEQTFLGVAGKTQAQKDREFLRKITGFINDGQRKLSTANGKIVVDTVENSAIVTIDGAEAGIGSLESVVQRGQHTVRVTAAGYEPFEETVTVEPAVVKEVRVALVALPMTAAQLVKQEQPKPPSFFSKPGLYLGLAGAALVGVGLAFGQAAQGVKDRIAAGGDPVDVTRAQAKAAPMNALLANILVGTGAAAVAGGVTWVLLTPTSNSSSTVPGASETVSGAMLSAGGTF